MKTLNAFLILMALLVGPVQAADLSLTPLWKTAAEFKNPESVVYDAKRDVLYVSNTNGQATEKDGNGFISQLGMDGQIKTLKWVEGMNSPKGLAIVGDKLYAADIDVLVEIDINSGTISHRYEAKGAKFLNDVAADGEGNVYVSDMLTNKIHWLHAGSFEVWLESDVLEGPNGLYVDGDRMYEGAWGVLVGGLNTAVPGHIKIISLKDKSITDLGPDESIGNMDGIEKLPDGSILATDWVAGVVMKVSPRGEVQKLLELSPGTADLTFIASKNMTVIPLMMDGVVAAYQLNQ